ncbi:MAG TPA: Crp/Fnr family transcriptional regulator [Pseudonocardiaceae bacterium]|jgi:CRP-like cAMP-binding protein|nr:Crp/Fnr family transcriptional regulator [Pseudonocardiaceae bacterium]
MKYVFGPVSAADRHYVSVAEQAFDISSCRAFQTLRANGRTQPFRRSESLMLTGDPSEDVVLVSVGLVKVVLPTRTGVDVVTGLYGSGELFGEVGVLHRQPRSATVIGHKAGIATRVPADMFRRLIDDDTEVRTFVDATQRRRLLNADRRQQALASMDVRTRVIAQLIEWATVCGKRAGDGLTVRGLSHRDLAGAVLASEKHVDAVLAQLRAAGWLHTRRMCIVLPDPERLVRSIGGLERWLEP